MEINSVAASIDELCEATTSRAYADLWTVGPICEVEEIGPSGCVGIFLAVSMLEEQEGYVGCQLSGGNVREASDDTALYIPIKKKSIFHAKHINKQSIVYAKHIILCDLLPGVKTRFTMKYHVGAQKVAAFRYRALVVTTW